MKRLTTDYVTMNPRHCVACWECVEKCPKKVIGKVGFLWHKHVVFRDADACIGCGKCIKTCPQGVFGKAGEASTVSDVFSAEMVSDLFKERMDADLFRTRKNVRDRRRSGRLLPLAFVASAVTGIGLHTAGHGDVHEVWHNWAVAHVLTSLLWLAAVARHIVRHRKWYKSVITRGISGKSRLTLALSAAFLAVAATGIVLLACVDGANSGIGMWHYRLGLLLIILALGHAAGRRRKRRRS